MSSIGRNEPCPCGSGKKYKQCCLGTAEAAAVEVQSKVVPAVLLVLVLAAGIAVGVVRNVGDGVVVAIAGLLMAGGYLLFRNPPPSNPHSGSPGGIDFGR